MFPTSSAVVEAEAGHAVALELVRSAPGREEPPPLGTHERVLFFRAKEDEAWNAWNAALGEIAKAEEAVVRVELETKP